MIHINKNCNKDCTDCYSYYSGGCNPDRDDVMYHTITQKNARKILDRLFPIIDGKVDVDEDIKNKAKESLALLIKKFPKLEKELSYKEKDICLELYENTEKPINLKTVKVD